jgi:hypothetical protein
MVPSPPKAHFGAEIAPDLAEVVAAWPTRPEALKAGILAMVKAAAPSAGQRDST